LHCDVPLIVDKNNMQGMKSATTYAKRIGVESLAAIAADDDDGNAAAKSPPRAATPPAVINAEQFMAIRDKAELAGVDQAKICAAANVKELHELPAKDFDAIMKRLQKTIDARAGAA
jgi:dissimilatory sulfite reductase (desulfoviridin) alpha/beta subunit